MSLAITEKRPQQRPSSCVGIFFRLFSKKKLFSKKLLPPAKNTAARKFTGDDQIPMGRLLLTAAENSSRYTKEDPEPEPESDGCGQMQEPCIVARLMGLDSMPVVTHEKPRKATDSNFSSSVDYDRERHDHGLCLDNAESRPQKQQKTGVFVEKAAADVFHRGLVTGSKKSPRLLSRSNTTRLVQVANRILEPGLHSKSRMKLAITHSSLECEEMNREVPMNDAKDLLVSDSGHELEETNESKSPRVPIGQVKNVEEDDQLKLMPEGNGNRKVKPAEALSGLVKNESPAIQAKVNLESRIRGPVERKQQEHLSKSFVKRNGTRQQNLLPTSRKQAERDLNQLRGSKDFVALNKNLNSNARSRSPMKASGSHSKENEKSVTGKKKPANSSQTRSAREICPNSWKGKSMQMDVVNRRQQVNSRSTSSRCDQVASRKKDDDNFLRSQDSGIVSFTFTSPMRRDSRSLKSEELVQRRGQAKFDPDACNRDKLTSDGKLGSSTSQKVMPLRGGELSNLLEEKIRELSSLDQIGLDTGDDLPGRSTASILQELISALTVGEPELDNNGDSASDLSAQTDISIYRNQISNVDHEFQEKDQAGKICRETNQPSPVSVLEAPFSNDGCSVGSPNDISDSATSLSTASSSGEKIHDSIDKSSSMYGFDVSTTEDSETTATISDSELLFETISANWPDASANSSLNSFLLMTLETILDTYFNSKDENQLREVLMACLMECLNTKISKFWISGLKTSMKHPMIHSREQLTREIHAEIRGWSDLAGKYLDDLVDKDISSMNMSWTDSNAETYDVVLMIQHDLLHTMVEEMFSDLCG